MTTRKKLQLKQLAGILAAWMLTALTITIYDHLVLMTGFSAGFSDRYSFLFALLLNSCAAVVGTALGGSFLVFYINVRYIDKPYRYTLSAVTAFFFLVILVVMLITGCISVPLQTGYSIFHPISRSALTAFLLDSTRVKNMLIWSIVVSITQLLLQVNARLGQKSLTSFILGRYYTPKEENKVFLFLDLNSSTTVAEQMGNEMYHRLLRRFFADISSAIVENHGEIYQYVGDEVIVAWDQEAGFTNNQCVKCFFDIKEAIQRVKGRYIEEFGFVPSFKAGIHSGKVVAGEVGLAKREITYSGDVLNTASRILNMCSSMDSEIILSEKVARELKPDQNFILRDLGVMKLRGKQHEVGLTTVAYRSVA
jgi:adenylate cyclase